MPCHGRTRLLTFAAGAITKHITDNDNTEAAGMTQQQGGQSANFLQDNHAIMSIWAENADIESKSLSLFLFELNRNMDEVFVSI